MTASRAAGAGLPRGPGPYLTSRYPLVDTDSHLTEPASLWADRLPSKYANIMPRVSRSRGGRDMWLVGDRVIAPAWASAPAGFSDYWPAHPKTIEDVNPAAYEPHARRRHLDSVGISSQVIYPNILSFNLKDILNVGDAPFHIACVQAYNDFLADFAKAEPGRFIPIMCLPFWDLEASVREVERCAVNGHRGILFGNTPEMIGLPKLRSRHWDPIFSLAESLELPVNFHIGFAIHSEDDERERHSRKARGEGENTEEARQRAIDFRTTEVSTITSMMNQANTIGEVILSGMCERYPKLNFVSVESGFGYLPYYLDALDWQWLNSGSAALLPERLMPSEYFKRQIYATFWFEHRTVERLIDLLEDNVMFESDFPHPTCLAPGPVSYTDSPNKVIQNNLIKLPERILKKLLYANAARVYRLDESFLKTVREELQAP
jgi:uncharacterized protein